jgi:hypothetical protein
MYWGISAILFLPWLLIKIIGAGDSISTGMFTGSLVTGGIFMTFMMVPGFLKVAGTKAGSVVLSIITALVAHKIVGGGGLGTTVAVGWAFVAKTLVLLFLRTRIQEEGA